VWMFVSWGLLMYECVCVGIVMSGCVYMWFLNVWLCVGLGSLISGCVYVWVM